jgi:hypothetical protein
MKELAVHAPAPDLHIPDIEPEQILSGYARRRKDAPTATMESAKVGCDGTP